MIKDQPCGGLHRNEYLLAAVSNFNGNCSYGRHWRGSKLCWNVYLIPGEHRSHDASGKQPKACHLRWHLHYEGLPAGPATIDPPPLCYRQVVWSVARQDVSIIFKLRRHCTRCQDQRPTAWGRHRNKYLFAAVANFGDTCSPGKPLLRLT